MLNKTMIYFVAILVITIIFSGCQGCGGGSSKLNDEQGSISGRIVDQNNEPVKGATCSIIYDQYTDPISFETDADGFFLLENVRSGEWQLIITKQGYQTISLAVLVNSGETTEVPQNQTQLLLGIEETGNLTGRVTDKTTGENLAGVYVSAADISSLTNSDGIYTLEDVPAGVQKLTASIFGYEFIETEVEIVPAHIVTYNFTLTPQNLEPESGKGNISGLVKDSNNQPLAGVSVLAQGKGDEPLAITDVQGKYLLVNMDPEETMLIYAKTEYKQMFQRSSVIKGKTNDVPTVEMSPREPAVKFVSKRVSNPHVGDADFPHINYDGSKVVFESTGNVITDWGNPLNVSQIYLWERSNGTITRLSNKHGKNKGGSGDSNTPRISGDGTAVVFVSKASDVLSEKTKAGVNTQIYYADISDPDGIRIVRVSNGHAGNHIEGSGSSTEPDINHNGTMVVFTSDANNLSLVEHTPGYVHVYRAAVERNPQGITVHSGVMMDSFNGREAVNGAFGGVNPVSNSPRISADGRYAVFASMADTDITAEPPASAGNFITYIYRHDAKGDSSSGWNIMVSKHNGEEPDFLSTSIEPCINGDGSKIAFTSDSPFNSGDAFFFDIFMWVEGNQNLTYISKPVEAEKSNHFRPSISSDGTRVCFIREPQGVILHNTCVMRDLSAPYLNYELISKGNEGQNPNDDSDLVALSGDGQYAVFSSKATNLTKDNYTQDIWNVFVRKIEEN